MKILRQLLSVLCKLTKMIPTGMKGISAVQVSNLGTPSRWKDDYDNDNYTVWTMHYSQQMWKNFMLLKL